MGGCCYLLVFDVDGWEYGGERISACKGMPCSEITPDGEYMSIGKRRELSVQVECSVPV